MNKKLTLAAAVALAVASGPAMAYDEGDWVFRVGAVSVNPNDDSSELAVNGGDVADTGVEVGNNAQIMLTATYMYSSSIGIELLAATPFEHDIDVNGLDGLGVPSGTKLGSVTHLPPTLTAVWYPMDPGAKFQPFVGAGINYTLILDEDLTSDAEAALAADDLSLDNSFGLALRAGFDVALGDNMTFNAGVWYIDIETEASLDTALGEVEVDVTIDPWVYGVGVGFQF